MESALSIVDLTYRSTRSNHYSGENEAPSGVGAKYAPKGVKSENLASGDAEKFYKTQIS